MKYFYYLLILLLSFEYIAAQSNNFNKLQMAYGQDVMFYDARNLALGGSGLAGGSSSAALFLNPALLSKNTPGLYVHFGTALDKLNEDRAYPYYDTFVGFNDYGSFSYNSHWYGSIYGNLGYTLPLPYMGIVSVAAGFRPFKDFRYDYVEEVRDPLDKSDKLLGYNTISQQGLLHETALAFSLQALKNLSVGVQAGILSGSIDSTVRIEPKAAEHLAVAQKNKLSKDLKHAPLIFAVGAHYRFNERFSLAGALRAPYTIQFANRSTSRSQNDTLLVKSNQKLNYPLSLAAGLEYRFQNILAARINLDFKYEAWSNFKDNRSKRVFFDTYTINTGIEHVFFDKVPLRAGFLFSTLPQSQDFSRTVITLGTGFEMDNLQIDFAGGVSSFKYYQEDLFPDSIYNLDDRSDPDRVQLTRFFVRLSLKYQLL